MIDGKVNCYPNCSDDTIVSRLLKVNPCIDIMIYESSMPLQDTGTMAMFDELIEFASRVATGGKTEAGMNTGYKTNISDSYTGQYKFMNGIYGFISLLRARSIGGYKNVPIFSSPQIQTKNGSGWKDEQSLFGFIQTMVTGQQGLLGGLLKQTGLDTIVNGGLNVAEAVGALAGWSPRVSPYFSFKDGAFSNKPSFSATVKLINDCEQSATDNGNFLNDVIQMSLIGSVGGTGFLFRWRPPQLYNIGIKWCPDGHVVKTLHLCSLDATVTAEGVMRKGIPDAYIVQLNFTSILPDTKDAWEGSFPLNKN